MKSIRIISRISAIFIAIILILYNTFSIEKVNLYIFNTLRVQPREMFFLFHLLLLASISIVFLLLLIKINKKTAVKTNSIIALLGILFLVIQNILLYSCVRGLGLNIDLKIFGLYSSLGTIALVIGNTLMSISLLRMTIIYPHKSSVFIGSLIFAIFSIIYSIIVFVRTLIIGNYIFYMSYSSNSLWIWSISFVGIAMFFWGLTTQFKKKKIIKDQNE